MNPVERGQQIWDEQESEQDENSERAEAVNEEMRLRGQLMQAYVPPYSQSNVNAISERSRELWAQRAQEREPLPDTFIPDESEVELFSLIQGFLSEMRDAGEDVNLCNDESEDLAVAQAAIRGKWQNLLEQRVQELSEESEQDGCVGIFSFLQQMVENENHQASDQLKRERESTLHQTPKKPQ